MTVNGLLFQKGELSEEEERGYLMEAHAITEQLVTIGGAAVPSLAACVENDATYWEDCARMMVRMDSALVSLPLREAVASRMNADSRKEIRKAARLVGALGRLPDEAGDVEFLEAALSECPESIEYAPLRFAIVWALEAKTGSEYGEGRDPWINW